jgi:hypothetical protein
MAARRKPIRVICRTLDRGQVSFNQVVMEQQSPPDGLLLAAIDPETGVYIWMTSYGNVEKHTVKQAGGYSRQLPGVSPSQPPPYLGNPVFLPIDSIAPADWQTILGAQTNGKNKAVKEALAQQFGF